MLINYLPLESCQPNAFNGMIHWSFDIQPRTIAVDATQLELVTFQKLIPGSAVNCKDSQLSKLHWNPAGY